MSSRNLPRRWRLGVCVLAAAPAVLLPGKAVAQPRVRLGVDATETISNNPFLIPGENTVTAALEVLARPEIDWTLGPGTTLEVSGAIGARQYHRRYGNFLIGHADAMFRHRKNEYVSFAGRLSYTRELPVDGLGDSIDGAFDTLSIRSTFLARGTATWNPNARTTIVGDLGLQRTSHPDSAVLGPTSYQDVRLAVSRRVSPLTNVGLAAYLTHGDSGFGGESSARGVQLTAARRLASHWRADAQLGVEKLKMNGAVGGRNDGRSGFSGAANFCYEPERLTLCLTGAVRSAISGIGGLQRETSFGGRLTHRLGLHQTIGATAEYRRSRIGEFAAPASVLQFATSYESRLNERLSLNVGVDYLRRSLISGPSVGAAFLKIGISWRGLGR